ncbi:hypothetical protein E2320_013984 [Naja naja]|nr:hypothetical protein E2320_013984 [Naja naja]
MRELRGDGEAAAAESASCCSRGSAKLTGRTTTAIILAFRASDGAGRARPERSLPSQPPAEPQNKPGEPRPRRFWAPEMAAQSAPKVVLKSTSKMSLNERSVHSVWYPEQEQCLRCL